MFGEKKEVSPVAYVGIGLATKSMLGMMIIVGAAMTVYTIAYRLDLLVVENARHTVLSDLRRDASTPVWEPGRHAPRQSPSSFWSRLGGSSPAPANVAATAPDARR